jgi:hypothetical protein
MQAKRDTESNIIIACWIPDCAGTPTAARCSVSLKKPPVERRLKNIFLYLPERQLVQH